MLSERVKATAIDSAANILLTHDHADHNVNALALAPKLRIPMAGKYDLLAYYGDNESVETIGFNKGGIIALSGEGLTMLNSIHSSSINTPEKSRFVGPRCEFMITGE